MKILIAGFKGDDNSAKILLDYIKKVCNEDILYLEEGKKLVTDYYYGALKENLEQYAYQVMNSYDAGKYLCNNVFFRALNFKQENNLKSKIAFIHIPTIDNIEDMNRLSSSIKDYIETLCEEKK